jgi:hypothetical protein
MGLEAIKALRPAGFHPIEHTGRFGHQARGPCLQCEFRLAAVFGEAGDCAPF